MAESIKKKVGDFLASADLYGATSCKIASDMGLANFTLCDGLKSEGVTFRELLKIERATRCYAALQEDPTTSSGRLAELCGYGDTQTMNRFFKEWFGCSLTEFKAQLEAA